MKNLEPNMSKEQFKIEIISHENCCTFKITNVGEYLPSYQEIIGCMEIVRMKYMRDQSEYNRKKQKRIKP